MEFINMTPHAVSIRNEAGEEVLVLAPSGQIARVAEQREKLGTLAGIEISRASYGAVEGLPEPRPGVAYIVSALVLAACQDRPDVFAPGPAVRDTEGRIVGARGLSASGAYVAPTPEPTPTPESNNNEFEGSIVDAGTYQAIRIYEVVGENEYEQNEDRYDSGHELVWVDASRGIATMKERVSGYEWEMRLDDLRQILIESGFGEDDWHEALNYVTNDV